MLITCVFYVYLYYLWCMFIASENDNCLSKKKHSCLSLQNGLYTHDLVFRSLCSLRVWVEGGRLVYFFGLLALRKKDNRIKNVIVLLFFLNIFIRFSQFFFPDPVRIIFVSKSATQIYANKVYEELILINHEQNQKLKY